jgi:hypothetical protein
MLSRKSFAVSSGGQQNRFTKTVHHGGNPLAARLSAGYPEK